MIVELIYLKIKFSRILFENFCLLMDTLLLLLLVIFNALSIQIHLKIKLLWSEFFSQVYIILKTFYFCTINIFLKNNFSFSNFFLFFLFFSMYLFNSTTLITNTIIINVVSSKNIFLWKIIFKSFIIKFIFTSFISLMFIWEYL